MSAEGAIIVFARLPVPGRVKTRLVPVLGERGAADLQARLLRRTLATATAVTGAQVILCHDGETDAVPAELRLPAGCAVRAQQGADLGQRMHAAFGEVLARRPWALLVGADCPARTTGELHWAAARLAGGDDAVLGPVRDGGYSLIGLRCPQPRLFERVPWSTGEVAGLTRSRMRAGALAWSELLLSWDVDVPADLARLGRLQPPLA